MNPKEAQAQLNYVSRFLYLNEMKYINCIRLNPNKHHDKHNKAVLERCLEYLYLGIDFITEARFVNGSRCDILLPMRVPPEIEEIMLSETDERFEAKNYPFKITPIRIKDEKT